MSTTGRYLSLLSALVAGASFWLAPSPVAACSCMEQPFETARASAVAIFEARVASIDTDGGTRHVHLDVVQTWLAAEHEHVEVVTADTEAACGFDFEVGESYLVYASSLEGSGAAQAYRVSLCSRTRPMEEADDDRALLGSGVVPVDVVDDPETQPTERPPPTRAGCASCTVGRGATRLAPWIATLLGAFIAARRRRA